MPSTPFFDFVTAINAHDIDRLHSLMTTDHAFVDAIGSQISGADTARAGWAKYFQWFPDYLLELTDVLESGQTIMATGTATATYLGHPGEAGENHWKIPVALKAILRENKIALWQVFADTKIPFDIIERNQIASGEPAPKKRTVQHRGSRVNSLGGIFFKCQDPEKVRAWYGRHLGLSTDAYGTSFAWKHWPEGSHKGFTAWSPFPSDTTYFAPSTKEFMLNYRVDDLERLVVQLKEEGVTILDQIETYPYGKFVHILDLENNKVELWQSDDEAYSKMLEGMTY
jgi:ketosteroid isomerase-like protein/catechol 2,3-dioxygenase-like lactoylglutathione lyase family enzyme